jgi:hypothetical protein
MNQTEASGLQVWFEARVPLFAIIGALFALLVIVVSACSLLFAMFFGCFTGCGERYKKALREKERLVEWKKINGDKGVTIGADVKKLHDLLDPGNKAWIKSIDNCTSLKETCEK